MNSLIILSAVVVAVTCQWQAAPAAPHYGAAPSYGGDPSLARILSDQRAHHIAGDFKVAVKQEDGTSFHEEAAGADGSRRGQYSYVDTNGLQKTVKWEAGRGGFKILNGNNAPVETQQTPEYKAIAASLERKQAAIRARVAEAQRLEALKPKPVEQPRPAQRRAPAPQRAAPVRQYQQPQQVVSEWNTAPQQQWQPAPQQQWQPAPQQQQYVPAPQPQQQQYVPAPQPQQQQYVPAPQPIQQLAPTTPEPTRFFPPGQLAFTRNNKGFQYSFSS